MAERPARKLTPKRLDKALRKFAIKQETEKRKKGR
jgi:hypothetical protein